MDAALSKPVDPSLSTERPDAASPPRLSLEEMEQVLRYWESLDDVRWDEATRLDCSAFIEQQVLSVTDWKAYLVKVPEDVETRYRKVLALLLEKRLIDQGVLDEELKAMTSLSPATLTRQGKVLADWYRQIQIDTRIDTRKDFR